MHLGRIFFQGWAEIVPHMNWHEPETEKKRISAFQSNSTGKKKSYSTGDLLKKRACPRFLGALAALARCTGSFRASMAPCLCEPTRGSEHCNPVTPAGEILLHASVNGCFYLSDWPADVVRALPPAAVEIIVVSAS